MSQKVANQLAKPLENFAFCYLGSKYVLNESGRFDSILGRYDACINYGIAGGLSSVVAEAIHGWVLPEVNSDAQLNSTASMVLNPVLVGAGLFSAISMGDSVKASNVGFGKIFLLGASSEVLSAYVNDRLVQPYLGEDMYYY